MWARISEIVLGVWLIGSHFIFAMSDWRGAFAGLLTIIFAALSYVESLNKVHLLQVLPAGLLLYVGYTYPTPFLPFSLQNYILTALSILMFAVIPSHASDHPRPWKDFLRKRP